MSQFSMPIRRKIRWYVLPIFFALLTGVIYLTATRAGVSPAAPGAVQASGQLYTVGPIDLEVKIAKDGELQAVNNIEILCQVEGQTTIQTIVKEGVTARK